MKSTHRLSVIAFVLGILTLLLVLANFNPPSVSASDAVIVAVQTTATPVNQTDSEIGSTDGILIMGIVIVLIVTLPLMFQKRK